MKKYLLSLITLALLMCEASFTGGKAFAFDNGNYTYTIISSTAPRTVSIAAKSGATFSGSITLPATVTYSSNSYKVTEITANGFKDKTGITSMMISNNVTTINANAFSGCTGMTTIQIPPSVTNIGSSAFNGCTSLERVDYSKTTRNADSDQTYAKNWAQITFANDKANPTYYGKRLYRVTRTGSSSFGFTEVTVPDLGTITSVKDYAFINCEKITSVTIPNTITSIGKQAFYGCSKLATFTTTNATSLTTIGYQALYGTHLSSIMIPENVTAVGDDMLKESVGLESVIWNAQNCVKYINSSGTQNDINTSNNPFYGSPRTSITSFTFGDNVIKIAAGLCCNMSELTTITIPSSVTTIGSSAFSGCSKINEVIYKSSAVNWAKIDFGNSTANPCYYAKGINFNNSSSPTTSVTYLGSSTVHKIKQYTFYNDTAITSLSFNSNVDSIAANAFDGCNNVKSVKIISKMKHIAPSAFSNCAKLNKVTWEATNYATLTSASTSPFYNSCTNIKTFEFISTLTTIPAYVCYGMTNLELIVLPTSATTIGKNAFQNCSTVATLAFPKTVTDIGAEAFSGCTGLTSIFAPRSTPPTCTANTFANVDKSIPLIVPTAAAQTAYAAATGWRDFNNIVTSVNGTCGANATWSLELTTGVLTISGTGAIDTYSTTDGDRAPWYDFRDYIKTVTINHGITTIGSYAFKNCAEMTSISLPLSLTLIEGSVFDGCTKLASYSYAGGVSDWLDITFSNTSSNPMYKVKKFYVNGSEEINNLVIPGGVTTIKAQAFYSCSGLTSVTIPASVTSFETNAFSTCTNINSVNYLGDITAWCNISFAGNTANPAFFSHSLSIDGVEQTAVYLDDDLNEIKDYVFYGNEALTQISIDYSTSIASNALTNCTADIVVRGEKVGTCGTGVSWSLLDGVLTIYGDGEIDNVSSTYAPWYSVRSAITKVVVESGVTKIGKYAFENASNLIAVYLPASVGIIEDYAFTGCSGIEYILCANSTPPTILDRQYEQSGAACDAFSSVPTSAEIYVPLGSETDYANALTSTRNTSSGWKRFSNFIAYTGTCGATGNEENVIWTFDPADNSITISGTGAMYDYNNATAAPWNTLKSLIAAVVIEDGVTKGGKYAFANCTALTDISLASSCTSFGTYAFSGCTALTEVELPEGITVTGSWMFSGCTSLADVTLPSTLTEVDVRTFDGTAITSIDIPEGVTNIDNYAFYNCTSLASIDIPSTLTRVSSSAFEDCSSLASIDLPEGLTYIGSEAFAGCSSLESITIPRTVTTVYTSSGSYTFDGCSALRTVNWNAEACADFNKDNSGSGFTYYTPFGNAKTTITAINFGSNVRIIPSCLCQGMTGITSVTLPASLEQIHQDAFNGCTGLTSITIPANVTTIQSTAFEGCTDIDEIIAYPETMPTMGTSVWNNVPTDATVTVYCPATETAYKENANWSRFTGTWEYVYGACDEELDADTDMSDLAADGYRGDLTVKEGTLTMDYISAPDVEINNLTVQPGARIELADDASYTIDNLILQRSGTSSTDEVATASIQGSLTAENLILDFELDDSRWFAISLPKTIAANSVKDAESGTALTPDEDYYALYFDGEARADDGYSATGSHWKWVTSGNLNAGQGYLIGLPDGSGTKTLRFTMADYTFDETADKNVAVSEYASWDATNAGWNLVGNPYLQAYHHSTSSMAVEDKTLTAMVTMSISGANISYNTPMVDEAIIPPFSAVFVQAPVDGSLEFKATSARKGMRARYAENKESEYRFLDITLTGNGGSNHTSFIVGNYSDDYSIGADMVKWFNDAYATQAAPTLYSFKWDHKEAVNARSEQRLSDIPLGYHATQAGVYTFALSGDYPAFEHIWLYDQEQSTATDLKMIDYEFYTEAGTQDARFTITAELPATGQGGATDITGNEGMPNESLNSKFIRNNRLFIRKGDKLYTVMGQETK